MTKCIFEHRFVIVDLDGTLCDYSQRVHWAQAKEWDEFYAGIPDDAVVEQVASFMEMLCTCSGAFVLVVTGRDEAHRKATEEWLSNHDLDEFVDELLMRPDGNHEPDHEMKLALVDEHFGSREKALRQISLVLEDRDKVVEAWRNAGFKCWQVQAGEY